MNPKDIKSVALQKKSKAIAKAKLVIGAITLPPLAIVLAIVLSSPAVAPTKAEALQAQLEKKEAILSQYKDAKKLSDGQLVELLYNVGFKDKALVEAYAIAKRESNGRPLAHNKNKSTGDNSYGIFQINMINELGDKRRIKYGLKTNEDLFNPVTNARIAFAMSKGGKNWEAWSGDRPIAKEAIKKFPKLCFVNAKQPKIGK